MGPSLNLKRRIPIVGTAQLGIRAPPVPLGTVAGRLDLNSHIPIVGTAQLGIRAGPVDLASGSYPWGFAWI